MDVDQQIFILQIGSGEIDEEGAECEVDSRLKGAIEEVEERPVIFYLSFVLMILLHIVVI